MIVGQLEEIRIVEADNELYAADSYVGGRVLVFALDTLAFKRGWGAYGKPLAEISVDDADHRYTPNGPMPRDFVGHLTINVSRDGLVYAADRNANRIHVTRKDGTFVTEWVLAPSTGVGGSTGGIAFSPDREQRLRFALASYNAGPGHVIDAQRLAEHLGLDPKKWEGNVERAILLLAKPRYYMRPEMKNGFCKGSQVFHYVRDVVALYGKLRARPKPMAIDAIAQEVKGD
jgi:hypothetical protein